VPKLTELTRATNPVVTTVAAVLLIILGILVIVYPGLIAWMAGIGLVLAGVAVLASVLLPSDRSGW
jgi:cyanate permease